MSKPEWHKTTQAAITRRGGKYNRTHRQGYPIWRLGRFDIGFAPSTPEIEVARIIRRWDGENAWDEEKEKTINKWRLDKGLAPLETPRPPNVLDLRSDQAVEEVATPEPTTPTPLPSTPTPTPLRCRYPPCPRALSGHFVLAAHRAKHEIAQHGATPKTPVRRDPNAPRKTRRRLAPVVRPEPATEFERIAGLLVHEARQAAGEAVAAALATIEAKLETLIAARLDELTDQFRRASVERDVALRDRDALAAQLQDIERALRATKRT